MKTENGMIIKKDELAVIKLCSLYEHYGYNRFKMNRFEPYDLYLENKNFLRGENIITFNSPSGKLLALKPDITLSIVQNAKTSADTCKVYYHENVYRSDASDSAVHEIRQAGIEYIGDIDVYSEYEVLSLAAKSMISISRDSLICISHMGIINGILSEAGLEEAACSAALKLLREKNVHDLRKLLNENNVSATVQTSLIALTGIYGGIDDMLPLLEDILHGTQAEAIAELRSLYGLLKAEGLGNSFRLDFSVLNDLSYYNGIIFQGYVEGVPHSVLSGGRYDNLIRRMSEHSGAIGFAIYIDSLERYLTDKRTNDYDVFVLYDGLTDIADTAKAVRENAEAGLRVNAGKKIPERIKCEKIIDLRRAVNNNG